jgi:hypothetical protein
MNDAYQEHEMSNGIYVIEQRLGCWMVWAPNHDQPFFIDHSYDLVKLMMTQHFKGVIAE